MNRNAIHILAALLLTPLAVTAAADRARTKELFDLDWRFVNGDVAGAEELEFDDGQWRSVDLPHDFSIEGPFDQHAKGGKPNGFRPLGIGWYRKSFATPAGLEENGFGWNSKACIVHRRSGSTETLWRSD
jgi:beta-galactosidase